MSRNTRTIKPRFWLLVIFVLTATFSAVYVSQQRYIAQQKELVASLKAEQQAVAEENAILQRKIDFTYTDEFIEREARSRLGLVKEDEILFETND